MLITNIFNSTDSTKDKAVTLKTHTQTEIDEKGKRQRDGDQRVTSWFFGNVVIVSGTTNNGYKSDCHAYHLCSVTLQKIHSRRFRFSKISASKVEWVSIFQSVSCFDIQRCDQIIGQNVEMDEKHRDLLGGT